MRPFDPRTTPSVGRAQRGSTAGPRSVRREEPAMRAHRVRLVLYFVTFLCPIGAAAVDGVNEINQPSILAAGGFPYTIPAPGSYVLTGDLTPPPGAGALVL